MLLLLDEDSYHKHLDILVHIKMSVTWLFGHFNCKLVWDSHARQIM